MDTVKAIICIIFLGMIIGFAIIGVSDVCGCGCHDANATYYLNHQKDYTVDTIQHSNGAVEYEVSFKKSE